MVTRIRIDAEGSTAEDVLKTLDAAFAEILNHQPYGSFTFSGAGMEVKPLHGTTTSFSNFSKDTEFIEEVIESVVDDKGVIRRKGRRTIKFLPTYWSEDAAS